MIFITFIDNESINGPLSFEIITLIIYCSLYIFLLNHLTEFKYKKNYKSKQVLKSWVSNLLTSLGFYYMSLLIIPKIIMSTNDISESIHLLLFVYLRQIYNLLGRLLSLYQDKIFNISTTIFNFNIDSKSLFFMTFILFIPVFLSTIYLLNNIFSLELDMTLALYLILLITIERLFGLYVIFLNTNLKAFAWISTVLLWCFYLIIIFSHEHVNLPNMLIIFISTYLGVLLIGKFFHKEIKL